MRLFIAAEPPENVREALAARCRGIDGARWVDPQQIHLTLRFIGETGDDGQAAIKAALGSVRFSPIHLRVHGAGTFPSAKGRSPVRVLWAGVTPINELVLLRNKINAALASAKVGEGDGRVYHPHVTLARFKHPPRGLERWLKRNGGFESEPWVLDALFLMASELDPDGARHRELARFPAVA